MSTASAESAIWLTVAQALNASSATASSSATTCKMVSTKWLLALYWRMVISVEAGAVAAPTAPSSSENDRERWKTNSITAAMAAAAPSDSSAVMTSTRAPLFFSVSHLK